MRKKVTAYFGRHQGRILNFMLAAIMVLFIGILIAVYFVSKHANPVFLDEKGRPVESQTTGHGY